MKPYTTIPVLSMVFLYSFSLAVIAEGIDIHHAATYLEKGHYYLDADMSYHFSDEAIEALQHGVALHINIDIKTKKKRKYLWDKNMGRWTIQYRLEYHPLSQRYLLTELNRLVRKDFRSLSNALDSLGVIKKWPLLNENDIKEDGTYEAFLKAKLDTKSLPAPLRPIASISSNWQLNSGPWYKWIIKS